MRVTLPEHIGEITLAQFQKYMELVDRKLKDEKEMEIRMVSIFSNVHVRDLRNARKKDYEGILHQIKKALKTEHQFTPTFKMDGVEFGMIPNFDDISTAEFADLELYGLQDIANYHRVMAILFRPITKKDFSGNYQIEPYEGTNKHAGQMLGMPLSVVDGSLLFFWSLVRELKKIFPDYLTDQPRRGYIQTHISSGGVGMPQFTD